MSKLSETVAELTEDKATAEEIESMFGTIESPDAPCSANKLVIQNNVVSIKTKDSGGDSEYNPGF
jgi:hypothetical protein